jgi:LAO/AO transport system kinase
MEVADLFVINKSDREGADRVESEVRAMQSLAHAEWTPSIVKTNSLTGDGILSLAEAIEQFHAWLKRDGRLEDRRRQQWKARLTEMVRDQILSEARYQGLDDAQMDQHAAAIAARRADPFQLVPDIVSNIVKGKQ